MAAVVDIPLNIRSTEDTIYDTLRQQREAFSRIFRQTSEDLWHSLQDDQEDLGWRPPRLFDTGRGSRNGSRSSSLVRCQVEINGATEEKTTKSNGGQVHEVKILGTDAPYRESRPTLRKSSLGIDEKKKNYVEIERDPIGTPLIHKVEIVEAKKQQKERRESSATTRVHQVEISRNSKQETEKRDKKTGSEVHHVEIHCDPSALRQKRDVQMGRHAAEDYDSSSQSHQVVINRSAEAADRRRTTSLPRVHHVEIRQNKRENHQEERRNERNISCERQVETGRNEEEKPSRIPVHHVEIASSRNSKMEAREDTRMSREQIEKRRASLVSQEVKKAAERRKEIQVHPVEIHNLAEGRKQRHSTALHQVQILQKKHDTPVRDVQMAPGQTSEKNNQKGDQANSRQNLLAEIRSRGGRTSRSRSSSRSREQEDINQAQTSRKVFKSHEGTASQESRHQEDRREEQRRQDSKYEEHSQQEQRHQERSLIQHGRRASSATREVKIQQVDNTWGKKEAKEDMGSNEFLLPHLLTRDSLTKDDILIGMEQTEKGLEISLNTQGFKASELAVRVEENQLLVEGLHEERTESGQLMVRRQLRRGYSLPAGTRPERVESSLGQDGVLRITVPKEVTSRPVNVQII
jgi:HSP20 family molecular chaperone IbpA